MLSYGSYPAGVDVKLRVRPNRCLPKDHPDKEPLTGGRQCENFLRKEEYIGQCEVEDGELKMREAMSSLNKK